MVPWKTPLSWRARTLALALGVIAAYVGPSVTPADAARGHVFSTSFGKEGPGNGELKDPAGIAVNEATGDVYVVDKGNNRVEYFAFNETTKAYEYAGQFNGSGELLNEGGKAAGSGGLEDEEPTGRFENLEGIAVDNSCHLRGLSGAACTAADPSNEDVYVVDASPSPEEGHKVVDKFTATGEYVGQITAKTAAAPAGIFFKLDGVAVDPSGEVLVAESHRNEEGERVEGVDNFSNAEANVWQRFRLTQISGAFLGLGFAVDSNENVYVNTGQVLSEGLGVFEFNAKGESLGGEVPVGGKSATVVTLNGVATEVSNGDVYINNAGTVVRFGPFVASGPAEFGKFHGSSPEVERFGGGELSDCGECEGGVAVDSATSQVFAGDAVRGKVVVFGLKEPSVPLVASESVLGINADSATLAAEINPQSIATEPGTDYRFEYGACASPATCKTSPYGSFTSLALLAPSFEVEGVSAHVQGLIAGTTYHFRVLAENAVSKKEDNKPIEGEEQTFTTQGTGEFALPDARQWEMVSPPQKDGALIEPLEVEGAVQAAAGGAAISYLTNTPTEPKPQGYPGEAQVLSTRGATGAWESRDLALPHSTPVGLRSGIGKEYRFFSEDLSLAAVQPQGGFIALSPDASEQTAYLNDLQSGGFTPLVMGCPSAGEPCGSGVEEHANVPEGTVFGVDDAGGGNLGCPPDLICGPEFVGGTPDLSHVVLKSMVALTKNATTQQGLYEWTAGKLTFIGGGKLGFPGDETRHAISDDGSRVFWSAENHLYVTDTVTGKTLQLDVPEPGCPPADECGEGAVSPEFQGASSDGSRVFFADTQKLTADGRAYTQVRDVSESAADLYECDLEEVAGGLKCDLSDLAPGGAQLGSVLGSGEDGSWAYFVANGVLSNGGVPVGGAVAGTCPEKSAGGRDMCNLYVRHDGETRLVGVLSGADFPDWSPELVGLTARVSPDGEWLAFMSQRSLTGYDNRDALSGEPDEEVYLYDGGTGRLVCASCDPTGARPHGVAFAGSGGFNMPLAGGVTAWPPTTWLAANIPTWTPYRQTAALSQARYLSDGGRLFFNSRDGLVPKDVNGIEDVYEYEPEGIKSPEGKVECSEGTSSGSDVFEPGHSFKVEGHEGESGAGCVGLISSGASAQESAFLDASQTGGDVFFMTTAKLAPQDFDDAYDVYDAQECTALAPCLPAAAVQPPACATEASCKAASSPQPEIFGPSGSATFSGAGNLAPPLAVVKPKTAAQLRAEKLAKALKVCKKDKSKKKRATCEKQARKKYGVSKAKKANNDRRAR